jgi:hypothetical protein
MPAALEVAPEDTTMKPFSPLAFTFLLMSACGGTDDGGSVGATVTVTPPGPHYVGDTVTVSVAAQPGYVIQQWSDGSGNATSRTLNLTGDVDVHATLVAVPVASGPDTHVSTSGTEITVTIPVTRAPATHCYRVRARLSSFYSPFSIGMRASARWLRGSPTRPRSSAVTRRRRSTRLRS